MNQFFSLWEMNIAPQALFGALNRKWNPLQLYTLQTFTIIHNCSYFSQPIAPLSPFSKNSQKFSNRFCADLTNVETVGFSKALEGLRKWALSNPMAPRPYRPVIGWEQYNPGFFKVSDFFPKKIKFTTNVQFSRLSGHPGIFPKRRNWINTKTIVLTAFCFI